MQKWYKTFWKAVWLFVLVLAIVIGCKEAPENRQYTNPIQIENPAQGYAGMSRMFATSDGLYMSWVEQLDSLAVLKYSVFDGEQWSRSNTIASGTDWFVNWADFPTIAVNKENIFAHYLQKSAPDTYAYDIKYKVFNKDSKTWSAAKKLHTDTTQSEHGFVSVIPYKEGFMASWLDGRTTVNVPDSLRQMTLRAGIINPDASLGTQWELDNRVCDCCATSIATDAIGPVVVYRDRSTQEVRDISLVRFINEAWTVPQTIHKDEWEINGCPVNGPAVTSNGDNLAVAWFTSANDQPLVKQTFLKGLASNKDIPIKLNTGTAIGRTAITTDTLGNTYALFMQDFGDESAVSLAVFDLEENMTKNSVLFEISSERASGFPQIEIFKDNLFVSYTESDKEQSSIKMLQIPLSRIEYLK